MTATTTKFTVSKRLLEQLGLTAEDLKRLSSGWYSRFEWCKPLASLKLPTKDGTATPKLHTTITWTAEGGAELTGMTVAEDEERVYPSIPANQQFVLDYAALCERSKLSIAIDCLPGIYLNPPGSLNHSSASAGSGLATPHFSVLTRKFLRERRAQTPWGRIAAELACRPMRGRRRCA